MSEIYKRYHVEFERLRLKVIDEIGTDDFEAVTDRLFGVAGRNWERAKQLQAEKEAMPEAERLPELSVALTRFGPLWWVLRQQFGRDVEAAFKHAQELAASDPQVREDLDLIFQTATDEVAVDRLLRGL